MIETIMQTTEELVSYTSPHFHQFLGFLRFVSENSTISPAKQISEGKVISLEEPKKAAAVFPIIFSSSVAADSLNQDTGASADIKLEKTTSSAFGVSEASAKPTETKVTFSNSSTEPSTSAALLS